MAMLIKELTLELTKCCDRGVLAYGWWRMAGSNPANKCSKGEKSSTDTQYSLFSLVGSKLNMVGG